jgi:hypothetical protein
MITAHFIVGGEEREVREVAEDWLERSRANHENVLLTDGNTYIVQAVSISGVAPNMHARVDLVAPQFARGS